MFFTHIESKQYEINNFAVRYIRNLLSEFFSCISHTHAERIIFWVFIHSSFPGAMALIDFLFIRAQSLAFVRNRSCFGFECMILIKTRMSCYFCWTLIVWLYSNWVLGCPSHFVCQWHNCWPIFFLNVEVRYTAGCRVSKQTSAVIKSDQND